MVFCFATDFFFLALFFVAFFFVAFFFVVFFFVTCLLGLLLRTTLDLDVGTGSAVAGFFRLAPMEETADRDDADVEDRRFTAMMA